MNANAIYEDGTYLGNNPTWHAQDSPWKARQIGTLLARNKLQPSTVCEIGCGAGEILSCLAASGAPAVQYRGFEISPQAFEICKRKEGPNLHFSSGDGLNDTSAVFDVVMAIDVVEHVEDYFGFLRKLRSRGMYKILHIPLDLSVQSVLRAAPILKGRSSVGHIHYFTKETALATLRDTGYDIVDHFYTQSSLELPNRGWKSDLARLPRKLLFSIQQDLAVRVLGGFSLLVLAR